MGRKIKKIVIVSAVFPPEQVTSALLNYDMAKELAKKYDVTVLRPQPTRPIGSMFPTDWQDPDFKTILINSYTHPESKLVGRMRESLSFGKKCAQYIEQNHNDIDFIYNGPWQLFAVYIIARVAVKYKIPYLMGVQDIYPESLLTGHNYPKIIQMAVKALFLPMDKYYTSHAVKVRTISQEMASYMSETRHLPIEHYIVLDNWQNEEDFIVKPRRKTEGSLVFAYVGSINIHSNVELIIRAFAEASIPNSYLRIYGGGNKKEQCIRLVNELGAKNISFSMVSRENVPEVQSEADVLVLALPKGNGGLCLPSKMTSYMLSGKPILASVETQSATVRYINEAQCGVSVEPDDIESLKEGFLRFGRMSKNDITRMGYNSKSFAEEHLTRKSNLPKLVAIFDEYLQ